ncbi:MAG TPA: bifunctional diaminohydroxyphosphoribosylaminopyrimidine deaminase/5-amino-6-(5-phosphoribosylamino)uracil reductase RibD [Pirellulales bacterium]|nr:bifunctional diaminohydroxyphosphoribosylaminopyrimidine deaminase/5-amino-6-(5-phosphoribosylamino)uracil reductase RibD [Pirellulales bacterium]
MDSHELDRWHMRRALELASLGRGLVEPNPLVGCVITRGAEIVAEGWHRRFGGPHAEVDALAMAGRRAAGATAYVTLEPCCHHGKTPPCTAALIAAGVSRVVTAMQDPFPAVAGRGAAELVAAGIEVEVGVLEEDARELNAPYLKLIGSQTPWVIAKWAMTLDGKIATHRGESRWISSEASRRVVHELRGRVDAVLVGSGTALADDPLLTARPPGPRQAVRIVFDSEARLPISSRLAQTASEVPLIVAAAATAPAENRQRLRKAGCEVLDLAGSSHADRLRELLRELGRRRLTNVLAEGGAGLLGLLADIGQIDEVHAFVAPRVLGGTAAPSPVAGSGVCRLADGLTLANAQWRTSGDDLYCFGRVVRQG